MNTQLTAAQQRTHEQDKTVEFLIKDSQRKKNVSIRNDFVQTGGMKKRTPGKLGALIKSSNGRSLDLYLLHRLLASADPWDTKRESAVWARALGLGDEEYGRTAVSRCWAKLVEYKLVSRERESKQAKIISLQEDGSLRAYTRPKADFYTLPLAYWTENWYRTLSYPAKAVLLISSSLQPGFYLPGRQVSKWYGISADTLYAGFDELIRKGLITYEDKAMKDYSKATVDYNQRHYTLAGPFAKKVAAVAAPEINIADLITEGDGFAATFKETKGRG